MTVGGKVLATPTFSEGAEEHAILRSMVEAKRQELKDLQVLMLKEQGYLKKLRDDQVHERQQVEQELRLRRQTFEKELAGERSRVTALQRNLEQVAADIEAQKKDLTILVANAEGIRREREQAVQERITMEQQRRRAEELKTASEASLNQLHAAQAQLEAVQRETSTLSKRAEQQDRMNQAKEEDLSRREQTVRLDLEQVTILRKEVDPKLEQLALKESQVKEQLQRTEALQRENLEARTELAQTRADLEGFAKRLEAKEQQLNGWELRLKQTQSELYLKMQQAKAKGIEVAMPEEPAKP